MTEKIKKIIEEILEERFNNDNNNDDNNDKNLLKLGSIKIFCYLEILKEIDEFNSEIRKISEFPNIIKPMQSTESMEPINPLNLEVRQSAILEKIKELTQSGDDCGLKELMKAFPDVSDRTLRYDLQKLISQGLMVKVGNRGPNTTYKVTDN